MKAEFVNLNDVKITNLRIDASYHLSEGQKVKRIFNSCPYDLLTISEVSNDIFYGNRARRVYVTKRDHGIPFLSSSDILRSDLENVKLASKKYTPNLEQMKLQKGWTLISRSGTIGNCAFANAGHAQKLASEDVIRLVPNNILRQGLIYAYLASKYGHLLLTQGTFGAVIQHIEPAFVGALPIPTFPESFQKEVDDLIQESATLRETAMDSLNKAVNYFNLKYVIAESITSCFTKKLKELSFSIASYNNNLEVDSFIDQFEKNSIKLKELTSRVFAPPLFKHIYLSNDNGYPFMTGSELTKFSLRYYRWLSPKGVKDINHYIVNKGTLLLYKSGTTDGGILGNVFMVDDKLDGCCLSDHVIRIVFNDIKMAYWTFAFLKCKGAVKMLLRLATGTMIPFITPERLSETLIPAPDENFEYVVSLIEKYINCNSRSKFNEEKAITLVESEIEKWNKN